MVQFLSIIFFLGFLQFLLGFSKVPVFCVTLYIEFHSKNKFEKLVYLVGFFNKKFILILQFVLPSTPCASRRSVSLVVCTTSGSYFSLYVKISNKHKTRHFIYSTDSEISVTSFPVRR